MSVLMTADNIIVVAYAVQHRAVLIIFALILQSPDNHRSLDVYWAEGKGAWTIGAVCGVYFAAVYFIFRRRSMIACACVCVWSGRGA